MRLRCIYTHNGERWEVRSLKPLSFWKMDTTLVIDLTGNKPMVYRKPNRGRRERILVSFGAHK